MCRVVYKISKEKVRKTEAKEDKGYFKLERGMFNLHLRQTYTHNFLP